MTAAEMAQTIGAVGILRVDGLRVGVYVIDVRHAFGRTDYRVRPVAGEGEQWVSAERVSELERLDGRDW